MNILFLQAGPPHNVEHDVNAVWVVFALVPVILILAGMVMGFRALHDIRVAGGSLGGAMMATFAAGLLPAVFFVIACGAGLSLLGQELTLAGRPRSDIWLIVGCGIGVWLSFLMMRGMHREATGWVRPAQGQAETRRSGLTTTAIVMTILGAAILLFLLLTPPDSRFLRADDKRQLVLLDVVLHLTGLISGVLGRRETAARVCAWISGSLFIFVLLMSTV